MPGYEAPAERTTGPGTRVVGRLVEVWEDAWRRGRRRAAGRARSPRGGCRATWPGSAASMGLTAPDALVARGMLAWAALFGCVSFEVFGQYGPDTFAEPRDIFEHHLQVLVATVGLA